MLLDANLVLTFLTRREDKYQKEIDIIMQFCHDKTLEGFVAFHSLSIIWYVLRKVSFTTSVNSMELICDTLKVAYANNSMILYELRNCGFSDFEDGLQDCCAQQANVDFIITANVKDYVGHSVVPAITPDELLYRLQAEKGRGQSSAPQDDTVNEVPADYQLVSYVQCQPLHRHCYQEASSGIKAITFVA